MASICSPVVIDSASSFRLRPGRDEDPALGAAGAADLSVQRHKWTIERFGQCDVPGVVAGQVAPQRPYALGKRRERKQLRVKAKQISVSAVGLESRDFAGSFQPAQNVARLGQRQLRAGRRILGERGFRPSPFSPRVDQNRDKHGRIDDDRHVRSASRARKMLDGRTRVPAASLRLRTPCNHASMEGHLKHPHRVGQPEPLLPVDVGLAPVLDVGREHSHDPPIAPVGPPILPPGINSSTRGCSI